MKPMSRSIAVIFLVFLGTALPWGRAQELKLTPQGILEGQWRGEAKIEVGKWKGKSVPWLLTFARGDLSAVSGNAIGTVKSVKAKRLNPSRPFKMTIEYEITGGGFYAINLEARLDPTCTRMEGTFTNIMGNGPFELVKQNTSPPKASLGKWTGQLTGSKGRWLRRGDTADLSLRAPEKEGWAKAEATLAGLTITRVVPSIWDEESRGAILFLECQQEGKDQELWLRLSGRFDESFESFTGEFESSALGSGELELKRVEPAQQGR